MSDNLVFLSNVRLSFPTLVEPKSQKGSTKKKYSADFLLTKDHPSFTNFMQAVNKIAVEKWKENATAVMAMLNNDRKLRCYGKGEEKVNQKTFKVYDGYPDHVYISANQLDSKIVQMIRPDGTSVPSSDVLEYQSLARKLYGGCYVNAVVKPWPQDSIDHGKGMRCELFAVQFAKDGEAFGEAPLDTSAMFKPVASASVEQDIPAFLV